MRLRYRVFLRLFPRAWRERYGDEVLDILSDEEGSALGPSLQLLGSGIVERLRQFRRLIWSGVKFAKGRTMALGAGLMVAAVAFSLLTASVEVGTARIEGVVRRNWRGAYDLLVLPARAGGIGTRGQTVQTNYLSAHDSGITVAQYRKVSHLPGVGVAAPLEVVGYVLETAAVPVSVGTAAGTKGARVLDLTTHFTADRGLSTYPSQQAGYVYLTPDPLSPYRIDQASQLIGKLEHLPSGQSVMVCPTALGQGSSQSSPFESPAPSGNCYSRQSTPQRAVQGYVMWSFPVLVAGIDPVAENRLTGMRRALVSGHYLGEQQGPAIAGKGSGPAPVVIPVLASTLSFDGEDEHVTVSVLPASAVGVARSEQPGAIAAALAHDKATPVMRMNVTGAQAWRDLLRQLRPAADHSLAGTRFATTAFAQIVGQYWTAGPVSFDRGSQGIMLARPVANRVSVWRSGTSVAGRSYVFVPPAAAGVGFRKLSEHIRRQNQANVPITLEAVGEFDPYRLAGFAGGRSPLASYRAPVLLPAGTRSRRLLGGHPLAPNDNIAGFAQQPPLLLTTLSGARALENPSIFSGTTRQYAAPIGSIRVRVSGLHGDVQEKLGKIAYVGHEIAKTTGLRVVVTAGSSPRLVRVGLPAGRFGRPALDLSERATSILVALVVLRQVDRESLALFLLVLVVCALFLSGAALAAVRSRREEIAILRALGWARHQVFALVLGEVAMLGMLAGGAGALVSAVVVKGLGLAVPGWHVIVVLPVAVVLAVVSGLLPAVLASRTEPAGGMAPAARAPGRRAWPVRSIRSMALTGVSRTLGRCALAAAALAIGVAGLTVLAAAQASFSEAVGDSALAGLVTASTRGTDLVSALLAVGLGATAVGDVTYLNLRERAGELAALAACGWGRPHLSRLLAVESLVTAVFGSLLGAAAGLALAGDAFGLTAGVVAGGVVAAAIGTGIAMAATIVVLILTRRRSLSAVLAADE